MGKEKLRTKKEIEVYARKKAIVYSVIFMTVTCILAFFIVYSSFNGDELRLSIIVFFILIYAMLLYINNRQAIERNENYKNELLYEKINLSQEKKIPVIPLDENIMKEWRKKGISFYAKLTENNNIYIYVKKDNTEEEYGYLGKGQFRKYYKII